MVKYIESNYECCNNNLRKQLPQKFRRKVNNLNMFLNMFLTEMG